ncbi:hypothetical protein FJ938_20845 [Mesorhizobium sp. B2-4-14]|uniref:hypothetical protein n=1 Tax=Mesorhizobium sp. B2-4-14 TaxID=2589935 RepID=UPI0011263866|nr:hypothetical protein [Mesorhizobium sp. B2-4-14]TPL01370.1 hypothetical protein FJ938_20845 [Mesorhizobium sp. B2-4-14]
MPVGEDPNFSKAMAELAAMRARGDIEQPDFEAARGLLRERYGIASGQPSAVSSRPNRMSEHDAAKKIAGWILIAVAAFALLRTCSKEGGHTDIAAREEPKDGSQCFSGWDGSSRELVRLVTERLRDPDSFQHSTTKTSEPDKSGHRTVLMEYRAKNGFGGYNVGYATGSLNISDCTITDFGLLSQ